MTAKIDLTKMPEPSWLKEVSPNSCVNLRDLAGIFKVGLSTMRHKFERGEFPPPDFRGLVGPSEWGKDTTHSRSIQWKVSTIRKFFKQHKEH